MTTTQIPLTQFIAEHRIGMKAVRSFKRPQHMETKIPMDHWLCTFNRQGRAMEIHFSMGKGHKGKAPAGEEVLDCVASDSTGVDNARSFEDWCSEYGYDTDSRKAEKTFNACKEQAEKLKAFLGSEAYETLLWNTERL